MSASPASAKRSDGWVRGYDQYSDDWDDEGPMQFFPVNKSNAVCLWQKILYAEGALQADGTKFPESRVTGSFTTYTMQATKNLQKRWGLAVDGEVGPATFGRAADELIKRDGSTARGKTLYLDYMGDRYGLKIRRNTEGKYLFIDKSGTWRQAGYDYLTCS
ncbi:peptidoglycan-binding protein [Streptomyces sp. KL116D]|uniref:peptidoglycan-binding domain-containing protein n=1 Tax=Streptomyces sp. KL116D TaxID=3045152 RepID=UPI0035581F45